MAYQKKGTTFYENINSWQIDMDSTDSIKRCRTEEDCTVTNAKKRKLELESTKIGHVTNAEELEERTSIGASNATELLSSQTMSEHMSDVTDVESDELDQDRMKLTNITEEEWTLHMENLFGEEKRDYVEIQEGKQYSHWALTHFSAVTSVTQLLKLHERKTIPSNTHKRSPHDMHGDIRTHETPAHSHQIKTNDNSKNENCTWRTLSKYMVQTDKTKSTEPKGIIK